MPLQKSSGVAILVSLQECGFFRARTVHRETNSEKPQVKIRFAFHFIECNKYITSKTISIKLISKTYGSLHISLIAMFCLIPDKLL